MEILRRLKYFFVPVALAWTLFPAQPLSALNVSTSTGVTVMKDYFSTSQSASIYPATYYNLGANISAVQVARETITVKSAGINGMVNIDRRLALSFNTMESLPNKGFYFTSIGGGLTYTHVDAESVTPSLAVNYSRMVSVQSFRDESKQVDAESKFGQNYTNIRASVALWRVTTISGDFSGYWYDFNPVDYAQAYAGLYVRTRGADGASDGRIFVLSGMAKGALRYSTGLNISHQMSQRLGVNFGATLNMPLISERLNAMESTGLRYQTPFGTVSFTIMRFENSIPDATGAYQHTAIYMYSFNFYKRW